MRFAAFGALATLAAFAGAATACQNYCCDTVGGRDNGLIEILAEEFHVRIPDGSIAGVDCVDDSPESWCVASLHVLSSSLTLAFS